MRGFERWFLTTNMTIVAHYDAGQLKGPVWRLLEENGFLVSDSLQMDGPDVLYVYPGFKIGLYGQFKHGEMFAAKPVNIHGKCRALHKFISIHVHRPSSTIV